MQWYMQMSCSVMLNMTHSTRMHPTLSRFLSLHPGLGVQHTHNRERALLQRHYKYITCALWQTEMLLIRLQMQSFAYVIMRLHSKCDNRSYHFCQRPSMLHGCSSIRIYIHINVRVIEKPDVTVCGNCVHTSTAHVIADIRSTVDLHLNFNYINVEDWERKWEKRTAMAVWNDTECLIHRRHHSFRC